jgi:hypothetical protein
MSFTLKPTQEDIDKVLAMLQSADSPLDRDYISIKVYGGMHSIDDRKTRLCIAALQEKGYLVYSDNGYLLAGDDPEPVIHYLNGLYSRAHKLTAKADTLYYEIKRKYGDEVAKRVEQLPKQPMIGFTDYRLEKVGEPSFHKSYDTKGNETGGYDVGTPYEHYA